MRSNSIIKRVLIAGVTAILILAIPFLFVLGVATGILGFIIVMVIVGPPWIAPLLNSAKKSVRARRANEVTTETPRTRQLAKELGVPLVELVRPPEKPVDVIVRLTEGGCPLMREVGDIFYVGRNGRLSSPLCSPSAAAVQRLIRNKGLESGTTENCVCPVGDYELTFALDAA